jgi:hypothetical protein
MWREKEERQKTRKMWREKEERQKTKRKLNLQGKINARGPKKNAFEELILECCGLKENIMGGGGC